MQNIRMIGLGVPAIVYVILASVNIAADAGATNKVTFGQSFNVIERFDSEDDIKRSLRDGSFNIINGSTYRLHGYSSRLSDRFFSPSLAPGAVLVVGMKDGVDLGGKRFSYGSIVVVEGTIAATEFRLALPTDKIVTTQDVTVFGKKYTKGVFDVPANGKIGPFPSAAESKDIAQTQNAVAAPSSGNGATVPTGRNGRIRVKSSDGKIDGILWHLGPPTLENADSFTPEQVRVLTNLAVRRGLANPEWGIYKDSGVDRIQSRLDLGDLRALGIGPTSPEGQPMVYRLLYVNVADDAPGEVYAQVSASIRQGVIPPEDGAEMTLGKCLPDEQKVLGERPITYDSQGLALVERNYSPPAISNAKRFPEAAIPVATAELIKDGLLRPQWGIYGSTGSRDDSKIVLEGKMEQANGKILYYQVGEMPGVSATQWLKGPCEVDATGTLKQVSEPSADLPLTTNGHDKSVSAPKKSAGAAGSNNERKSPLPKFKSDLSGSNEVRVRNPNTFSVTAGLRAGDKGKDFEVPANGVKSVYVTDGEYDIYFVYSDKPDNLFQGDSFTLNGNGIEIQIVQVVNGNYDIRQVK